MFSSPGPRATPRRSMKPRESLARPPALLDRAPGQTPDGSRTAVWLGRVDRTPPVSVAESTRAGTTMGGAANRHDDALDRTFWSRDERRAIASAGGLPKEVVGLIKASGMSTLKRTAGSRFDADGPKIWFEARSAAMSTCKRALHSSQPQKAAWSGTTQGWVSRPSSNSIEVADHVIADASIADMLHLSCSTTGAHVRPRADASACLASLPRRQHRRAGRNPRIALG